jgi:hypothetical protein
VTNVRQKRASATKIDQVWQCPKCQREYHSPMVVSEVFCGGLHLGTVAMKVISGPPPIQKEVTPRPKKMTKK